MELRFWFDGVDVSEEPREELAGFPSKPLVLAEIGNESYIFRGNGWRGYVLGGIMATHEDDGDALPPSHLLSQVKV